MPSRLDARGGFVGDLHRIVLERGLMMEQLFTFAYLANAPRLTTWRLTKQIERIDG